MHLSVRADLVNMLTYLGLGFCCTFKIWTSFASLGHRVCLRTKK